MTSWKNPFDKCPSCGKKTLIWYDVNTFRCRKCDYSRGVFSTLKGGFEMRASSIMLLVILGLVLISVPLSCHIVPPGHRGVAVTLGKVQEQMRPEGLTWKLPLVTGINDICIRQITIDGQADTFSSDLQTVKVKFNILYRIPQSRVTMLYQRYQGNPYEALVEPRAQEIIKQVTALHRAEDIVKKRLEIKTVALSGLRAVLISPDETQDPLMEIIDIVVNNIDLTAELERAIEAKQVMEQAALMKVYELQKAQKEAEITVVNAKAEAEAVRVKGEALRASPEVISLEIAKKWNGIAPQFISTTAGGANVLLPLAKGKE